MGLLHPDLSIFSYNPIHGIVPKFNFWYLFVLRYDQEIYLFMLSKDKSTIRNYPGGH